MFCRKFVFTNVSLKKEFSVPFNTARQAGLNSLDNVKIKAME
jgi:hypothetical protein